MAIIKTEQENQKQVICFYSVPFFLYEQNRNRYFENRIETVPMLSQKINVYKHCIHLLPHIWLQPTIMASFIKLVHKNQFILKWAIKQLYDFPMPS
jgi:hypothetical protein